MNKIEALARMFSMYSIYPASCYVDNSPVRIFQKMFPDNHYARDMELFLKEQQHNPQRRGADLPWWGKHYFSSKEGLRTMIITQDSLALDAGSIVFFAHLMPLLDSRDTYEQYTKQLNKNQSFRFASWRRIREQMIQWGIDFDFLYVTDAAKVYIENSRERFDLKASEQLLREEIEFCNPDLLILLGGSPLKLLQKDMVYTDVVEKREFISVAGKKTVVSPFPSGNGLSQKNFNERLANATSLIQETLSKQSI
ncbi:hypothetical protein [Aneurinibacillus danicus]|uniref:Uracil-DNA glycosylase-like domain-containing protein n=1 Tax=Aneurinibacillus danicus TaxID=267746 RepID=A0A511VCS9_9BACL|nr:hypothetical protein [Aneurinibacillus danicus]GEN36697.1 hypothetical protein ADA01nite_41570 [Aneurinibacillus danicus]